MSQPRTRRRTRALALASTALTAAALIAAPPAGAATAPGSATDLVTLEAVRGSGITTTVAATSGVTASGTPSTGIQISGDGLTLGIAPPTGGTLQRGPLQVAGTPSATSAGFTVTGAPCANPQGFLLLHEITADGTTLQSFGATFQVLCEGQSTATVGELRYQSAAPFERFGPVGVGEPLTRSQTFTAPIDAEVTIGQLALEGTGFSLSKDTCSTMTIAAGASCTVDVTADPTMVSGQMARLVAPVSGGASELGAISLTAAPFAAPQGAYTPLASARLLDTRLAVGIATKTPLPARASTFVQVTGRGGVPETDVTAVVVTLTAVTPLASGFASVTPKGSARTTSSINFLKGLTRANLVTVPVGADGQIELNTASASHFIIDVTGYYRSAGAPTTGVYGGYRGILPFRFVDTRKSGTPLAAGQTAIIPLDLDPLLNKHLRAVAVNVTAVSPTKDGWFTAWNGVGGAPGTSNVNFAAGRDASTMAIIGQRDCDTCVPQIAVKNSSGGTTHLLIDIIGGYDDGLIPGMLRFRPVTPQRLVDTRLNQGMSELVGGRTQTWVFPKSMLGADGEEFVANATAVLPSRSSWVTVWPNDTLTPPESSILNPYVGDTLANMIQPPLGPKDDLNVRLAGGVADWIIDVSGVFHSWPAGAGDQPMAGDGPFGVGHPLVKAAADAQKMTVRAGAMRRIP